jgi:hypothetical protein
MTATARHDWRCMTYERDRSETVTFKEGHFFDGRGCGGEPEEVRWQFCKWAFNSVDAGVSRGKAQASLDREPTTRNRVCLLHKRLRLSLCLQTITNAPAPGARVEDLRSPDISP